MTDLVLARSLFGTTMGFHIIYASLGVGIPLMILLAELIFQKTKDPHYAVMAKRWTKAQAVLLGVAIPTGTILWYLTRSSMARFYGGHRKGHVTSISD